MSSTFSNLVYHIVYSTKDRVPAIVPEIRGRLYSFIGGVIRAEGGILLEIGGMPDHLHVLARLRTEPSVATVVRQMKSNSSKWARETFGSGIGLRWQTGYGAFSVSASLVETTRRYILTQENHHEKVSFRDELIALLEENDIEYDERYLLG